MGVFARPKASHGWRSWVNTVDHKKIGIMYGVASFFFTPAAGKCEVQFRVRMAQTQKIVVVAEMSDGSLWSAAREVKVTIGGCGG